MQSLGSININSDIFTRFLDNSPTTSNEIVGNNDYKIKFDKVMKDSINKVNESQVNANNKVEAFIKGEDVSMHEVMLSMQESQMSMQLMLEVRNKLFDAYKEINGVQL